MSDQQVEKDLQEVQEKMTALELNARRRLSLMTTEEEELAVIDGSQKVGDLDPAALEADIKTDNIPTPNNPDQPEATAEAEEKTKPKGPMEIISKFHSVSRVGYVPFNNTKVNQDRACESHPFGAEQYNRAFFGVFDGHGQFGHHVSQFCATNLPKLLSKQPELAKDPVNALNHTFHHCHLALVNGRIDSSFSGTTAVCTYIQDDTIYCANVGDSRCVLGSYDEEAKTWFATDLSQDHKPSDPREKERIINSGGRVATCYSQNREPIGPLRVWLKNQEIPGLAMTRSFGDKVAASVGVSHLPEIMAHQFVPGYDRFMILASDGVWEFISSAVAVDIVSKASSPEEAAIALYKHSDYRWRTDEEVVDDITVLVVFFKSPAELAK